MAHTHIKGFKKPLVYYLCRQTSALLISFQEEALARKTDAICRTLFTISSCSYFILDLLPLFFLTDPYHVNLFHHITFMLAYHKLSLLLQSLKVLLIYQLISPAVNPGIILKSLASSGWCPDQLRYIFSFTIRNATEGLSHFSNPIHSTELTTSWSSPEHLTTSLCFDAFILLWHA